MKVIVAEAGPDYVEPVEDSDVEVSGDEQAMIEQAKAAVAAHGYRVMPDAEGGCREYCQRIDAYGDIQESIAITVYPEAEPARE